MRSKSLIFGLLLWIVPGCHASTPAPVDCTHLMAWTAGAVPARKLAAMVEGRGISFAPTANVLSELRSAGATAQVLDLLQRAKRQGTTACPASLVHAAALVRAKDYAAGADSLDSLLAKDPRNDALHFLAGYVKQRQGDWNGAFDEYSTSKEAEPTFPETHNRLALFFYQAGDGDNARS